MKKLIVLVTLLTSTLSGASELKFYKEFNVSNEDRASIEKDIQTEDKYYGDWECESRAVDGAGGIGQGYSRHEAASASMYHCRNWSVNPYSCRVVYCGRI